jgi:protein phosphatase
MKIFIISDLHANLEALAAVPDDYDELWVLGDLVNYGPNPAEAIEFVRSRASLVIRGNHDHAVGFEGRLPLLTTIPRDGRSDRRYARSVLSAATSSFFATSPLLRAAKSRGPSSFCVTRPRRIIFGSTARPIHRSGGSTKRRVPGRI